ncbi:MAG: L,D-transpeptidase family protein [Campylobacterota bacterium]|nr:L,D-transpeptidase family protein [Campylobacterota bacterium]
MNISKILLATLLLFSFSHAKHSFKTYDDICEKQDDQECLNDLSQIKNLQLALNADKNLKLDLTVDGKWGDNTKVAVQKFQEHYNVLPAAGYVGSKTKYHLDKVACKSVKFLKVNKAKKKFKSTGSYAKFKRNTNLKRSFKVFKDRTLLRKANAKNTKIKVDISEQRIRLYVDGKVAICSPCTTGSKRKLEPNTKVIRDKRTPKGTFKITEKISDKRSTIFGKYYRNGKLVYKGDRRKYRGPKAKYVGASLKNWMRLTSSGIGLHASKYVKRYPGTNGCIRLPFKVASIIFAKVKTGTKVSIVN